MKSTYISFIILLLSSVCLYGQADGLTGSIDGNVKDANSGEAIPGAHIYYNQNLTVTDVNGYFRIDNLKPGSLSLRTTALGFTDAEKSVDVSIGKTIHIHFDMQEGSITTKEVVVTTSKRRNGINSNTLPVQMITQQQIQQVNACDLGQALSFQTGVRVENTCQSCGVPQARINGLDGQYTQILMDGKPLISGLGAVYALEQTPTAILDRIEVMRSGTSVTMGSNAIGGAINMLSKDIFSNQASVSTQIQNMDGKGFEEHFNTQGSLVSKDHKTGVALYQGYRHRDPYDANSDGFTELGKLKNVYLGTKAYYRPTDRQRIELEYHYIDEFRRGGSELDKQPHQTMITEQLQHAIHNGSLGYDLYWGNYKNRLSIYAALQHINRDSYFGSHQDTLAYGSTTDLTAVAGARITHHFQRFWFAPAKLLWGAEYLFNNLRDQMIGYHRDVNQVAWQASAYVENSWQMEHWDIMLGVRMDKHSSIDNPIFSPRVNLLYRPNSTMELRLTYGTGFRAPQIYDEDLHVAAVGGEMLLIQVDPNLKQESSHSLSGSWSYAQQWSKWKLQLQTELFYTHLNDIFVLEAMGHDGDGNRILERRNGKAAFVAGGNLDFTVDYNSRISLQVGATGQTAQYTSALAWSDSPTTATTYHLLRSPDWYGYAIVDAKLWRALTLNLSATLTGDQWVGHFAGNIDNDRLEHVQPFCPFNAQIGYTFALDKQLRLNLSGGVKNILNSYQSDLDSGIDRDSKYIYGPTQPRTYFISMVLNWNGKK